MSNPPQKRRHGGDEFPYEDNPTTANNDVCYGALLKSAFKFIKDCQVPHELSSSGPNTQFLHFTLSLQEKELRYVLSSGSGSEFAILDTQTGTRLRSLSDFPDVHFQAVFDCSSLPKKRKGSKFGKAPVLVTVNIFGPRQIANDVGSVIHRASGYLQHPKDLPPGVLYFNPQFMAFEDDDDMGSLVGATNDSLWARKARASDEVENILESLGSVGSGSGSGIVLQPPKGLVSTLKQHQEDALRFIAQHEDETFVQSLASQLHLITRHDTRCHLPTHPYGGLIADLMGLGKTLTMLAAISSTMDSAKDFATFFNFDDCQASGTTPIRSTLVVVPYAQLIASWQAEIRAHFKPNAFKVVEFHGSNKPRVMEVLLDSDPHIVLTTYATLVSDHKGGKLLHKLRWFRVVLDEAHYIRNNKSQLFQAVSSLISPRRWCVSGTPIQNRIDDLASLAEFLQLAPFPSRAAFQAHILAPLSEGGAEFAAPLRTYLKSYCLRRTEKYLNLPQEKIEPQHLQPSDEEQQAYQQVQKRLRREIDELVSQGKTLTKYNKLFTAILRLRMVCNLGTIRQENAQNFGQSLRPREQENPCENQCERCSALNEDISTLIEEFLFCPDCARSLNPSSPSDNQSISADYISQSRDSASPLPFGMDAETNVGRSKEQGFSTKLMKVVQNVLGSDPSDKHIIFSSFTSTLDALARLFAGLNFTQVDGRTSFPERSRRLDEFRNDSTLRVLLMSIGTGAVGLNLSVANRVHIVEPQWNPSVEEQAVARALRMGQTREVKIFRYMMKGTVEQRIEELQKKKKQHARFAFGAGLDNNVEEKLAELKFVLEDETAERI